MHEGEVITPSQLGLPTNGSVTFAGQSFPEYPVVQLGSPPRAHQELPVVIATGSVISHATVIEADYKGPPFSDGVCNARPSFGVLCAYDGRVARVGRVITDSSFHHFMDINLVGTPLAGSDGGGNAHVGFVPTSVLNEIKAFWIRTAIWLARPVGSPAGLAAGGMSTAALQGAAAPSHQASASDAWWGTPTIAVAELKPFVSSAAETAVHPSATVGVSERSNGHMNGHTDRSGRSPSVIHFIGGEKGGVGKSVVARLLAEYCIEEAIPFAAADADGSNRTLLRYYGAYTRPVDLARPESIDDLCELALNGTARRVLVDLPSQSERTFAKWMAQEAALDVLRKDGVSVVFWHVMDDGTESLAALERLIDRYGSSVRYCVVKNYGRGSDFSMFDGSSTRARAETLGAVVIELEKLQEMAMHKLDLFNASYGAAIHDEDSRFDRMDRQRISNWMRASFDQLAPLGGLD